MPLSAPESVQIMVHNSTLAEVHWEPVSFSSVRGKLQGYKVLFAKSSTACLWLCVIPLPFLSNELLGNKACMQESCDVAPTSSEVVSAPHWIIDWEAAIMQFVYIKARRAVSL